MQQVAKVVRRKETMLANYVTPKQLCLNGKGEGMKS
jgi:hypothetical protein